MDIIVFILYPLIAVATIILFIYVLIQRINQKDDFEDRDN